MNLFSFFPGLRPAIPFPSFAMLVEVIYAASEGKQESSGIWYALAN